MSNFKRKITRKKIKTELRERNLRVHNRLSLYQLIRKMIKMNTEA